MPLHNSSNFDLEAPGSRFTSRPAIAILPDIALATRYESGDTGAAGEAVKEYFGDQPLETLGLRDAQIVDGSVGRGAAGWIPVIEWIALSSIGGVLGNAAWEGIKAAAKNFAKLLDDASVGERQVYVSRGGAMLLAIEHLVTTTDEAGPLDVELVEEPSSLRGANVSELSYTGFEPWLVCIQNAERSVRYVVAVKPNGVIAGAISIPMNEFEAMFSGFPSRPPESRRSRFSRSKRPS